MTTMYNILSYLILYFTSYINISFLLNEKIQVKLLLLGTVITPLLIFIPNQLVTITILLILIFIFYVANRNLKKIISASIFHYFILLIIDTIYSMILITSKIEITNTIRPISSIIICFLSLLFTRRKIFLQLWNVVQNKFENYICSFGALILVVTYINIGYRYDIINIFILIGIILILIYIIIKELVQSYITKSETEKMIEYKESYEKQINELMVNQHEYKNTLLCIKEMIPKNKKAKEFIDSILKNEESEDYDLLKDVLRVKISPVKGLIYHKLLLCKEKGIYTVLNVSSAINFKKLNKININTLRDITMILGVLLDNAIEACIDTKQKSLSIYMYEKDNEIIFQISNTFKGTIDLDLISKINYSSKGKNRGYGLTLAKRKVEDNKNLSMKSEISNDIFIQYLHINLNEK